jgi:hypothetical protein
LCLFVYKHVRECAYTCVQASHQSLLHSAFVSLILTEVAAHAYTHTRIHMYTHTHVHTYTYTHAHTHTYLRMLTLSHTYPSLPTQIYDIWFVLCCRHGIGAPLVLLCVAPALIGTCVNSSPTMHMGKDTRQVFQMRACMCLRVYV